MNKYIFLILTTMILFSCNNSTKENEPKKSKTETDYEIADRFLKNNAEKIGLISIIKGIPHGKVNSVLRDYLAKTFRSKNLTRKNPNYVVKVIDTIAQKNNLSKKLTASIIFSYQYEMIIRNEIGEGMIIDEPIDETQDYEY